MRKDLPPVQDLPDWVLKASYSKSPREVLHFAIPAFLAMLLLAYQPGIRLAHVAAWLAFGLFLWTLIEYVLHRFLYHWSPRNPRLRKMVHRIHIYHHERPNEITILNAGPLFAAPTGIVVYAVILLCARGDWRLSCLIMGGSMIGYVLYEFVHYAAHAGTSKHGVMGFLRSYHMVHHHAAWGARFGVTTPFWDLLAGTYRVSAGPKAASSSAR